MISVSEGVEEEHGDEQESSMDSLWENSPSDSYTERERDARIAIISVK